MSILANVFFSLSSRGKQGTSLVKTQASNNLRFPVPSAISKAVSHHTITFFLTMRNSIHFLQTAPWSIDHTHVMHSCYIGRLQKWPLQFICSALRHLNVAKSRFHTNRLAFLMLNSVLPASHSCVQTHKGRHESCSSRTCDPSYHQYCGYKNR